MKFPIVLLALASSACAMVAPRITSAPGLAARQAREAHDHDQEHDHSGSIPPPPS
jgi:hypothetical protein